MSLIEEALRRLEPPSKTEEELAPAAISSAASQTAVSVPVEPPPQPRSDAHSWSTASPAAEPAAAKPALSLSTSQAILITAVAAFLIGGWWMGQSKPAPVLVTPAASAQHRHPAAQKPAPMIRPAANPSVAAPRSQGELQLSGIVVGGRTAYAVINGSIFTVGDSVGDSTLTGVTRESATLHRTDGTEVVLRIAH